MKRKAQDELSSPRHKWLRTYDHTHISAKVLAVMELKHTECTHPDRTQTAICRCMKSTRKRTRSRHIAPWFTTEDLQLCIGHKLPLELVDLVVEAWHLLLEFSHSAQVLRTRQLHTDCFHSLMRMHYSFESANFLSWLQAKFHVSHNLSEYKTVFIKYERPMLSGPENYSYFVSVRCCPACRRIRYWSYEPQEDLAQYLKDDTMLCIESVSTIE